MKKKIAILGSTGSIGTSTLEVIKKGSLKTIAPSNTIICDIAHNPAAGLSTRKYLDTLDKSKNVYLICGMMKNKIHDKFLANFKQVK